jgi:hypothetical protein
MQSINNLDYKVYGIKEKIDLYNKAISCLREAERLAEQANQICAYVEMEDSETTHGFES